MFERFTDRSRQVVTLAEKESRALDHDYIGTEHLLLALMNLEGSVSHEALVGCGYDADALRKHLTPGHGTTRHSIPFTPRAKKALELSLREALQYGHRDIDDHHLLLGILRMDESTALTMLAPDGNTGVVTRLRQAICKSPRVGVVHISQLQHRISTQPSDTEPPSESTNLMTQIVSRLEGKSEAELKSLLDSLV